MAVSCLNASPGEGARPGCNKSILRTIPGRHCPDTGITEAAITPVGTDAVGDELNGLEGMKPELPGTKLDESEENVEVVGEKLVSNGGDKSKAGDQVLAVDESTP